MDDPCARSAGEWRTSAQTTTNPLYDRPGALYLDLVVLFEEINLTSRSKSEISVWQYIDQTDVQNEIPI